MIQGRYNHKVVCCYCCFGGLVCLFVVGFFIVAVFCSLVCLLLLFGGLGHLALNATLGKLP